MSIDKVSARLIWNEAKNLLKKELGEKRFSLWLARSRVVKAEEGHITIGLPNAFMVTMVNTVLGKELRDTLKRVLSEEVKIEFIVDAELFREYRKTEQDAHILKENDDWENEYSLLLDRRFSFDNFVTGKSNSLAYRCAVDALKEPCSCGNPLLLYGPSGSGKTHLLNAIGIEALKRTPKVVLTSPQAFADAFYRAMRNGDLMRFRRSMRTSKFFLFDEAERVTKYEKLHDEFLYTFEQHLNAGNQIVAAFSRHPEMVLARKKRLRSRFLSGMLARIELPERDVRRGIAQQVFDRLPVELRRLLTPDAADFIADNFRGEASVVLSAARQVTAYLTVEAAQRKEFVSQNTIRTLLGGLIETRSRDSLFASICEIVAEYFSITEEELTSGSRKRYLSLPRNIFFYIARTLSKEPFATLGEYMNRTHTAAYNGFKEIKRKRNEDSRLDTILKQLLRRLKD